MRESGTIRIISNKPDPSAFKAGYDLAHTINRTPAIALSANTRFSNNC